jgi:uncharacterized protein YjbI with pentapeptide repeats
MSEQQSQTASAVQATHGNPCSHSWAEGKRWGDPITRKRQEELLSRLRTWQPQVGQSNRIYKEGPFSRSGIRLTGADIFFLAAHALINTRDDCPDQAAAQTVLEHVFDSPDELYFKLDLSALHLEGAHLWRAHLEGVYLATAHLEGAQIDNAFLNNCYLREAHLEGASLISTNLKGAWLRQAHLKFAHLGHANLVDSDLESAHLEFAYFANAHLEGANLRGAHLEEVNLSGAWLDSTTVLSEAALNSNSRVGDIHWGGVGGVDLSQIDWSRVLRLGDELGMRRRASLAENEAVVRAYRQLAAQLRAQGMNEVADRFLYRAQVLQRRVLRRQGRLYASAGSWFLDLVSGHGYKPSRAFMAYVIIVGAFAVAYALLAYFGLTAERFPSWDSFIVLSVTSFHGRIFFAGGLPLDDWAARVGAIEAVVGLLIEITFIATFTQRFFAR